MRRIGWLLALGITGVLASESINPKYADSSKCMPCHTEITKSWKSSLHAMSHYSKNELYRKMIHYVSKKRIQSFEQVEIRCAQCHNPHIASAVSESDISDASFGIASEKMRKGLDQPFMKDGVNCIVCHNIEKIHFSDDPGKRGKDTIQWGPNDTMVGPFSDAKSPYHKTKSADFFKKDPNKLCFVCHYNERSPYRALIGSTGIEYQSSGSKTTCVECHMGAVKKGHAVQVDLGDRGTSGKIRELRSHLFAGARNSDILADAIDLSVMRKGQNVVVTLKNRTPHNVPTGFGGRQLIVTMKALDASGRLIQREEQILEARYLDKYGRESIPHLAKDVLSDTRLKPNERRTIEFKVPAGSNEVIVDVKYRLIGKKWIEKLNIEDEMFKKEYPVASMQMRIR